MVKAPIYNLKAENIGEITLPKAVFEIKISPKIVSNFIRIYQSNIRSAHAKVKDRGEVAGTTKKMWAQKGTGRARHGSAKAPLFVGGGIAHGPQGNQNFKLKINKQSRKNFIKQLLSQFAKDKSILVIDSFKELTPKTKEAWNFIGKLEQINQKLADSQKICILTLESLDNVNRAFRNISGFKLMNLASLNPLTLSNQNFLILSQDLVASLAKKYD